MIMEAFSKVNKVIQLYPKVNNCILEHSGMQPPQENKDLNEEDKEGNIRCSFFKGNKM